MRLEIKVPSVYSKTTLTINSIALAVIPIVEVVIRVWPEFAPLVSANVAKSVAGLIAGANVFIQICKILYPTIKE